ncbi:hypothetical protein SAMN05421835_108194 [Amycolatopsis sacchari]|uniref:Uncharacterized protein n=1 Tax=Amycolatopsis sacchari TaxID=115433 RepID=A0A1I3U4V3_9PSEU|nr:hypothetical protein [Amycolatopsis sacchari]SFJ76821.1 hypothetical protein SAMN05421835_108194 [Amycolatopsis sacchari]
MRNVRITSEAASEVLFAQLDEDIAEVVREDEVAAEVAEIDALVEQAEREWAAADRARERDARVRRRSDREVLRGLHEAVAFSTAPVMLGGYEGQAA